MFVKISANFRLGAHFDANTSTVKGRLQVHYLKPVDQQDAIIKMSLQKVCRLQKDFMDKI